VDLLEKVRWAEQPLADTPPEGGDAEKKRLEADLARTTGEIGSLRKALEEASGRPASTGEEPPDDGAGKALFPRDIAAD
jgi:hypothetical protein